jgi:hypothetical protein
MNHMSECGCGYQANQESCQGAHHSGGDCCDSGHTHRRFFSKDEIINHLEEYLQQLQSEAKGVEEHIAQLKKAK